MAVVDDQPHYYPAVVGERLRAHGHEVVHHARRVEDLPPGADVDVVLCDLRLVRLPGLTGSAAVAWLVAAGHRVLVTSALAGEEEVLDALAAGAGGYLSKDRSPDEHVEAALAVARDGVHIGPELALVLVADARRRPLPRGDLSRTELGLLRALARGDRPEDAAHEVRVPAGAVPALAARCLDVARRRRLAGRLSERAREVLELVGCRHLNRKEVAAELHITDDTLGEHLRRIRAYYLRLRPQDAHIRPLAAAEALARLCGLCGEEGPAGVR